MVFKIEAHQKVSPGKGSKCLVDTGAQVNDKSDWDEATGKFQEARKTNRFREEYPGVHHRQLDLYYEALHSQESAFRVRNLGQPQGLGVLTRKPLLAGTNSIFYNELYPEEWVA